MYGALYLRLFLYMSVMELDLLSWVTFPDLYWGSSLGLGLGIVTVAASEAKIPIETHAAADINVCVGVVEYICTHH